MVDVFVSSDSVNVIGGISNVSVDVDYGPQGDRGNLFLVGYGVPSGSVGGVTNQLLDIYINVQSGSEDYLMMYQYQNVSGTNTWVEIGKLITDKFSINREVAFVSGVSSTTEFKISSIIPLSLLSSVTKDNFNVQYSILHNTNPISSSMTIGEILIQDVTGDLVLPITINAIEYSEGAWSGVNETLQVQFLITVV